MHKILLYTLWNLRTSINETLGISPYQVVFGQLAIGPLQLTCDNWMGKRPLHLAKVPANYLRWLEVKLLTEAAYSEEHATHEQGHVHNYNLRSRDESFQVGERVIYVMPSSTHKLSCTWIGQRVIVKKNSPF